MNKAKMESALTLQITRLANPTWDSIMVAYPPHLKGHPKTQQTAKYNIQQGICYKQ